MNHLVLRQADRCAFCDYLTGVRPFTILHRNEQAALLVTREQRGISHLLAITTRHAATILDLRAEESHAVMDLVRAAARAIDSADERPGISIWQNNGEAANQAIPHFHMHVAGTVPGGGTEFGDVRELTLDETEGIADRLRPHLVTSLR